MRSSIKDFLRKINNNKGNSGMSVVIPSASNAAVAKIFQPSITPPSTSQLIFSSLSSPLRSSQSVPMSLRSSPFAVLDEIRQQQQQQQQFEELQQEKFQMQAIMSGMPSHQHHQDAMLLETFKKQNAILWERLRHYEGTIENLEESQSKLARANTRLEVDLHDQIEINKNLVRRNTDIVLDNSAKDQRISVLNEQSKCLTQQNTKLKLFLRQTDSCLGSLQSQQHVLQLQQEKMQRTAVTTAEAPSNNSGSSSSKKRKRDTQQDEKRDCGGDATDGDSVRGMQGNDTTKDTDDSNVISISSIMEEDNTKDNRGKYVVSD